MPIIGARITPTWYNLLNENQFILGIESSCDDTSVAVIDMHGQVCAMVTYSQIMEHQKYRGVVPEIAARAHSQTIIAVIDKAIEDSGFTHKQCVAVSATAGPGLIGGVIVGTMVARALAVGWGVPYIAVNHLEAHALSPKITNEISFPYLLLLVSGGHCQTLVVKGLGQYELIGQTIDDSAGEAFDKCAKILGLGYPGGPLIEQYAKRAVKCDYILPIPMANNDSPNFSFSGLKSALNRIINGKQLPEAEIAEWAFAVQYAVNQALCNKTAMAMHYFAQTYPSINPKICALAGGVAANGHLRGQMEQLSAQYQFTMVQTDMRYCTDNGAMVANVGWLQYLSGQFSALSHPIYPQWPLAI